MVNWLWLLAVGFGGFSLGIVALAIFASGRDEHFYRQGYFEGHEEGYKAGVVGKGGIGR